VNGLPDLKTAPDPAKVNLVFCKDAFAAGDVLPARGAKRPQLAGGAA
jgi:hypothetical protein